MVSRNVFTFLSTMWAKIDHFPPWCLNLVPDLQTFHFSQATYQKAQRLLRYGVARENPAWRALGSPFSLGLLSMPRSRVDAELAQWAVEAMRKEELSYCVAVNSYNLWRKTRWFVVGVFVFAGIQLYIYNMYIFAGLSIVSAFQLLLVFSRGLGGVIVWESRRH